MSLDGLLLEKLARWRPDGRDTLEVNAPEAGWSAVVTADAADLVGCRLWELSLRPEGATTPLGDLRKRAEAISGRVTGLLETLRVVEVDEPRGVALIRSAAPSRRDDVLSYYEILLHGNGVATVRRYECPLSAEARRQQVTFALTYETLGKLVVDLTS
jgi:hypothetical protein